jgi:multiple sugar transport system permease protein
MKKKYSFSAMWYILLVIYAVIAIFPFAWMLLSSLKPASEVMAYPPTIIPKQITLDNYKKAWSTIAFAKYFKNSAFISILSTSSVVITALFAAYSLIIIKVKGQAFVYSLVMFGLIVPVQTSFIPIFMLINKLHLIDTYLGVFLPYLTSAFGVFILSQFLRSIPMDLIDAARIDGMGEMGIIFKVVTPLSKPGILTLIIFTFMNIWKDFFWPFLLLNKDDKRTLPLGIVKFWQSESPHYGTILAAGILAMIPLIVIYSVFQKQFVQGITFSGIKE